MFNQLYQSFSFVTNVCVLCFGLNNGQWCGDKRFFIYIVLLLANKIAIETNHKSSRSESASKDGIISKFLKMQFSFPTFA
jgi:hypothetical protein